MAKVCVVMSNGFEEVEAITLIDVLRRAGAELTTFGVEGRSLVGAHGVAIEMDAALSDLSGAEWELVVLPGGMPNASTLRDSDAVKALLKTQAQGGGRVAAICAAPIALGAAGLLEGKKATCYPGFEEGLVGATLSEDAVVRDGTLTTSRGPGTAMAFALSLAEQLFGEAVATEVAEQMLVA